MPIDKFFTSSYKSHVVQSRKIVAANGMAFIDRLWDEWSPGYDAGEDLALVKGCLADRSNLSAAIEAYRATNDSYWLDQARLADERHLVTFHHDPAHSDDDIDRLTAAIKELAQA
jgi:uncharacterized protein YyaL (SSP411 family)